MRTLPLQLLLSRMTVCALLLACALASRAQSGKLRAVFVDVEGGQATLFVSPAGESLLIDTGWPGHDSRDADRIAAAARSLGLTRIDYVLITHYHDDHVGGVPQLVGRIPVGTFIDHGPNREQDGGITEHGYNAYLQTLEKGGYRHIVARPGQLLPIRGMRVEVVSGDGDLLRNPLAGAGQPNPFCEVRALPPADATENSRSLGVAIRFGRLRLLDLGDLTADKERGLVCPSNLLGPMDVYIVSHHGWNQSSSAALVDALHARVAIMDNGEAKGGSTSVLDTVAHAPGLETLWQLHYSAEGGEAHNTAPEYIANLRGTDPGFGLELTGSEDGSFSVHNLRTGAVRSYAALK